MSQILTIGLIEFPAYKSLVAAMVYMFSCTQAMAAPIFVISRNKKVFMLK